jgi:hypothetical protein
VPLIHQSLCAKQKEKWPLPHEIYILMEETGSEEVNGARQWLTSEILTMGDWDPEDRGLRPAWVNSSQDFICKITRAQWTEGVSQAVENLLCKCKVLSSNPSLPPKGSSYWKKKALQNTDNTRRVKSVGKLIWSGEENKQGNPWPQHKCHDHKVGCRSFWAVSFLAAK